MGRAHPLVKRGARRGVGLLGALLALVGCAAGPRGAPPPPSSAAAVPKTADAGLDWRPLLPAPFGTLLKDMPLTLHEVLLFHDETHASADTDNKDCYASDRTPPQFLGGKPRVYLFCFTHDRLTRIEALVDMNPADAYPTFARACELWHKHSGAAATNPPAAGLCEGQDVGIGYSGSLATDAESQSSTLTATFTAFSLAEGPTAQSPAVEGRPTDGGPITPPHP